MKRSISFNEKYLKQCRSFFPIYGKQEKKYLRNLKIQLQEYLFEFPNATYDDFIQHFGPPSDIIIDYYNNIDCTKLLHKMNIVKNTKKFFAVCICLLIIFFSYRSYVVYQAYLDAKETIIIHEETTIH